MTRRDDLGRRVLLRCAGRRPSRRPRRSSGPPTPPSSPPTARCGATSFVGEQGLFAGNDPDDVDDDPRTVVLVARAADGDGARRRAARARPPRPRPRLVDAAAGWSSHRRPRRCRASAPRWCARPAPTPSASARCASTPPCRPRTSRCSAGSAGSAPATRVHRRRAARARCAGPSTGSQRLADADQAASAALLAGAALPTARRRGFVGDDGAPVPGTDLVAACDAILPSMVERDPEWAGWCGVLVNVNDLSAMGAAPVGLLDALGARDASFAAPGRPRARAAAPRPGACRSSAATPSSACPAALSVTALGRTDRPGARAAGGRPGDALTLTADLGGGWRPGYTGAQWDSTVAPHRAPSCARSPASSPARARPRPRTSAWPASSAPPACWPRPAGAAPCSTSPTSRRPPAPRPADWLTCFPGFAMLTADDPGAGGCARPPPSPPSAGNSSLAPASGCAGPTARRPSRSPARSPGSALPRGPPRAPPSPADGTPPMRIALLTYSTKPRGGVVHTLALAEALAASGHEVTVGTLGRGGDAVFFRAVDPRVTMQVVPFPDASPDETVGERIVRSIEVLRAGLDLSGSTSSTRRTASRRTPATARPHRPPPRHVHDRRSSSPATTGPSANRPPWSACPDRSPPRSRPAGTGRPPSSRTASTPPGSPMPPPRPRRPGRPGRVADRLGRYVLAVGGIEPRKGTIDLLSA